MTNRDVLLERLSTALADVLKLDEVEINIDTDSFVGGFQLLASHIDLLIKNMEKEDLTAEEIIKEIKIQLDNGPEQSVLN